MYILDMTVQMALLSKSLGANPANKGSQSLMYRPVMSVEVTLATKSLVANVTGKSLKTFVYDSDVGYQVVPNTKLALTVIASVRFQPLMHRFYVSAQILLVAIHLLTRVTAKCLGRQVYARDMPP